MEYHSKVTSRDPWPTSNCCPIRLTLQHQHQHQHSTFFLSRKNAIRLPCGKISNPTSNCDPICLTLQHQHSSLAASGPSPHRQSRQNAMRLPCGKIS